MANTVRIIDTGQTLGTNVVIKEDKVQPAGNADIQPSSSPIPAPLFGIDTPGNVESSQTLHAVQLHKPETYFMTQDGGVKLHRVSSGQMYLSLRPTALTLAVSAALAGAVAILFVRKVLAAHHQPTTAQASSSFEQSVEPEVITPMPPRSQIRRLTL